MAFGFLNGLTWAEIIAWREAYRAWDASVTGRLVTVRCFRWEIRRAA